MRAQSLCPPGVWSRRADLSAHPYMHKNRESGADAGSRGITLLRVRPPRASCIGISQQWRVSLRDGNSVTPGQVTSITVEDESMNLTAWPTGKNAALGCRRRAFWVSRTREVRCWQKATSRASDTKICAHSQEIAVLIAYDSARRRHYLSFVAMECLRCVITAYIKSRRDPRGSARSL